MLLVHAKLGFSVDDQLVDLLKGAGIEQDVNALAGGQFPTFMLRFDTLQPAAETGLILHLQQAFEFLFV